MPSSLRSVSSARTRSKAATRRTNVASSRGTRRVPLGSTSVAILRRMSARLCASSRASPACLARRAAHTSALTGVGSIGSGPCMAPTIGPSAIRFCIAVGAASAAGRRRLEALQHARRRCGRRAQRGEVGGPGGVDRGTRLRVVRADERAPRLARARHRAQGRVARGAEPAQEGLRPVEARQRVDRRAVLVEHVVDAVARDGPLHLPPVAEVDGDSRRRALALPVQHEAAAEHLADPGARVERGAEEAAVRARQLLVQVPEQAQREDGLVLRPGDPHGLVEIGVPVEARCARVALPGDVLEGGAQHLGVR